MYAVQPVTETKKVADNTERKAETRKQMRTKVIQMYVFCPLILAKKGDNNAKTYITGYNTKRW